MGRSRQTPRILADIGTNIDDRSGVVQIYQLDDALIGAIDGRELLTPFTENSHDYFRCQRFL